MQSTLAAAVLALAVSISAPLSAAEEKIDQKFAADAAKDSMAEVQLGQLALRKSNDEQVREFANRMIQDHSKASAQLESIAKTGDVVLPSEPGDKLQVPMNKLSGLSGLDFDRAYAGLMVEDHQQAVRAFQEYALEGRNERLRPFAQQTLPTLQEHLRMAEKLQSDLAAQ